MQLSFHIVFVNKEMQAEKKSKSVEYIEVLYAFTFFGVVELNDLKSFSWTRLPSNSLWLSAQKWA